MGGMGEVFVGSAAVAAGRLTRHELRRWYRPIYRGIYLPAGSTPTLRDRTVAAWLASGRRGVITGAAASALHGAEWVADDIAIELIAENTRAQTGLIVRDEKLSPGETIRVAGLPVTTSARTAYDLGRFLSRDQAVARMDALARATPFSTEAVSAMAEDHAGARGLRRLRMVLPLVDAGAQSPRESRLRLLIIDAGLPWPTTQIPVIERGYWPFAWLDMGWRKFKVAVEYDGDHHRKDRRQYVKDQRRLRRLERLGWIVIRVIAEDDPAEVIRRVHAALRFRGWQP